MDFRQQLEDLLAQFNTEENAGTQDYVLAQYIQSSLDAFDEMASNVSQLVGDNSSEAPSGVVQEVQGIIDLLAG